MPIGHLFLLSLLNGIGDVLGDVGNGSRGRFLSHDPQHVVCPSGYVDHTQGKAGYWRCAAGCPGEWAWGDVYCGCACVLPKECVLSTLADPCVTRWELDNLGDKVLETRVATPAPAPLWPSPTPYVLPKLPAAIPTSAPIDYRTEVTKEPWFLRVATTTAPTPEDSTGLIVTICVSAALLASVCVISACICWMSGLVGAQVLPSTKVYADPEASTVGPLPHLIARPVQPKAAWANAKMEDGLSNVSTHSPRSLAPSPPPSARSSQLSMQSSPRSPQPSIHSSSRSNLDQQDEYERELKRMAHESSSGSSQPSGSPRPNNMKHGARLSPRPIAPLSQSPRSNHSRQPLTSPRVKAHSQASPRQFAASPRCSNLSPGPVHRLS